MKKLLFLLVCAALCLPGRMVVAAAAPSADVERLCKEYKAATDECLVLDVQTSPEASEAYKKWLEAAMALAKVRSDEASACLDHYKDDAILTWRKAFKSWTDAIFARLEQLEALQESIEHTLVTYTKELDSADLSALQNAQSELSKKFDKSMKDFLPLAVAVQKTSGSKADTAWQKQMQDLLKQYTNKIEQLELKEAEASAPKAAQLSISVPERRKKSSNRSVAGPVTPSSSSSDDAPPTPMDVFVPKSSDRSAAKPVTPSSSSRDDAPPTPMDV